MQFEEFADCLAWFKNRHEGDKAWKVSVDDLLASGCNLDRRNPKSAEDLHHTPPEALVAGITEKEERILDIVKTIRALLEAKP
jgi:type I restriction enzyme M protein